MGRKGGRRQSNPLAGGSRQGSSGQERPGRELIHRQDIAESHARSGFNLVYFWIAHGGSYWILREVLPALESKWPDCHVTGLKDLREHISTTWDVVPLERGISLSVSGSHAGEFETSITLSTRPDLVQMNVAEKGCEAPFESIAAAMAASGIHTIAPNGVLGDQRRADSERGKRYLDKLAAYLVADLEKERRKMKGRARA